MEEPCRVFPDQWQTEFPPSEEFDVSVAERLPTEMPETTLQCHEVRATPVRKVSLHSRLDSKLRWTVHLATNRDCPRLRQLCETTEAYHLS